MPGHAVEFHQRAYSSLPRPESGGFDRMVKLERTDDPEVLKLSLEGDSVYVETSIMKSAIEAFV